MCAQCKIYHIPSLFHQRTAYSFRMQCVVCEASGVYVNLVNSSFTSYSNYQSNMNELNKTHNSTVLNSFHIVIKMPSIKHSVCLKKTGCNWGKLLITEQIVRSTLMLSLTYNDSYIHDNPISKADGRATIICFNFWVGKGRKYMC